MSDAHAKLSPSGSYRRIKCPGSLLKELPYPNETNKYAEEGSSAHALAEQCLKECLFYVPDGLLGFDHRPKSEITIKFEADEDMAEAVEVYLEEVETILRECGIHPKEHQNIEDFEFVFVERKVQMKGIHTSDAWGTLDLGAYDKVNKRVYVRDLKYGMGIVDVEIEDDEIDYNTQLMEYAYGLISLIRDMGHKVEDADIGIVQPRAPHKDGPCRSVIVPASEIVNFIYEIDKPSAEEALQPGAPLAAGKWCKYCRAQVDCDEYNGHSVGEMEAGFGALDLMNVDGPTSITLPSIRDMSNEQLNNALNIIELITDSYGKLLKEEALRRHSEDGEGPTDWVISETNPHRKWKPEAEDMLSLMYDEDDIYEKKLKSPAQMEKTVGRKNKDEISSLTFKPQGVLKLSPAKTTKFIVEPKEKAAEGFAAYTEEKG